MTFDFSKLQGQAKTVRIGLELPEDEQHDVEIYPLATDDYKYADFSGKLTQDEQFERVKKLISKMLRAPEEIVGTWNLAYIEDLAAACMKRLNVTDEKQARVKKMLEDRKAKEAP